MASETTCQKLYDAIRTVDLAAVKDLLNLVDLSSEAAAWPAGDPPLVLAAKTGHEVTLLRELLEHRCTVDASSATGETALHCVAALWEAASVAEAVRLLLHAGSDPGLADNLRRQLPLHLLAKRCGAGGKRNSNTGLQQGSIVEALKLVAESGCDVNARDHSSRTPLHLLAASHCTTPEPYRILLSRGADVGLQNDRGETPLLEAMESGAMFAAELLLREANSPPSPPLSRCLSVVDEEPNRNSLEQPKLINGQPQTKIEQLTINGQQPKVNGEQPKVNGEQPKTNGQPEMNGEQPKINGDHRTDRVFNNQETTKQPAIWLMRSTLYGETALHVAARKDHVSLVELMLGANHEPELTGACDLNGDTALHLAAGRGHVEVVRQLVACADINARNKKGLTPLHVAVESGFIPVVKLLLERPTCDVLARTSDERRSSPLDLAQHEYRRRSQPEMSVLLVREAEKRNLPVR